MGYPGIGVMSTFAAPTLNSPLAMGCTGAGRVPAIPPHPMNIVRDMAHKNDMHKWMFFRKYILISVPFFVCFP
jgi:hypothetical protein